MDSDHVRDILQQAAELVAGAAVPSELRAVAFGKAVDLLTGTPGEGNRGRGQQGLGGSGLGSAENSDDLIQKIATKLDLDRELVDETFEVVDGDIRMTIARTKLESSRTGGTKQIAVLLAAARQAAGLEEKTRADIIRAVADEYGKYDSANFSTTLHELGDYFGFSGTSRARELKVKRAGYDEAAASITRLRG